MKSKSFSLSDEMWEEMRDNLIKSKKYQVLVHVHTHPYFQGDFNRHYSQEDINFYKSLCSNLEGITSLGCMLSVSYSNMSNQDDISFVLVDPITNEIYNIPNIFVKLNNQIIPLQKQQDVYIDQASGNRYSVERTLFEINENLIHNSGGIRR